MTIREADIAFYMLERSMCELAHALDVAMQNMLILRDVLNLPELLEGSDDADTLVGARDA